MDARIHMDTTALRIHFLQQPDSVPLGKSMEMYSECASAEEWEYQLNKGFMVSIWKSHFTERTGTLYESVYFSLNCF